MDGESELITAGMSPATGRVVALVAMVVIVGAGLWLVTTGDTNASSDAAADAPNGQGTSAGREVAVVNQIDIGDGERVELVCRLGDFDRFDLREVTTTADGTETVVRQTTIARPRAMDNCRGCSVNESVGSSANDPVLFGNCVTGMANAASIAYAVVTPTASAPALAFRLDCGVTNLRQNDDGDLVLISSATVNELSTIPRAQIVMTRSADGFEPDQPALFGHYCLGTSALVDTPVGAVRLDGDEIVALYGASCEALQEASGRAATFAQPLADAIGIPPPEGRVDWRLRCAGAP